MLERDSFQSAPASAAYVARPAVDTALESLLEFVRSGLRPVALVGPAGVGKTFLLQLLAERCREDFECVRVPVPSLSADELFGWVRARRGLPIVASPREQLVGEIRVAAEAGRPLLIAIDDAGLLPDVTAESLCELHGKLVPALRLVLAVRADEAGERMLARLGPDIDQVRFDSPMTLAETAEYVRARIACGALSENAGACLDDERLEELQEHTGGIPARVNELAGAFLRVGPDTGTDATPVESHAESLAFALLREVESEQRVVDWSDEHLAQVITSRRVPPAEALPTSHDTESMGSADDLSRRVVSPTSALLSRPSAPPIAPPSQTVDTPLTEYPELVLPEPGTGLGSRIVEALGQDVEGQAREAFEAGEEDSASGELAGLADLGEDVDGADAGESEADSLADRIFGVLTRQDESGPEQGSEASEFGGDTAARILGCLEMPELSDALDRVESEDVSARFASLCGADDPVPDAELTAIVEDEAVDGDEAVDDDEALLALPSLAELGVVPDVSEEQPVPEPDHSLVAFPIAEVDLEPAVAKIAVPDGVRESAGIGGRVAALAAGVALLIAVGVLVDQIWGARGTVDSVSVAGSELAGLAETAAVAAVPAPRVEAVEAAGVTEEIAAAPVVEAVEAAGVTEEIAVAPVVEAVEAAGVTEEIAVAPVVEALEAAGAIEEITATQDVEVIEAAGTVEQTEVVEAVAATPVEEAVEGIVAALAAVTAQPVTESVTESVTEPISGLEIPEELVTAPMAPLPTVDPLTAEAVAMLPGVVTGESDSGAAEAQSDLASREQRLAAWYGGTGWTAVPWANLDPSAGLDESARSAQGGATSRGDEGVTTSDSSAEEARRARPSRAIAGMEPPLELAAPSLGDELLPVTIRARRGSRIEIDGVDRGRAPLFGLLLPAGSHRIVELSRHGTPVEVLFEVSHESLRLDFTRDARPSPEPVSDTGSGVEPQRVEEAGETSAQVLDSAPADAAY